MTGRRAVWGGLGLAVALGLGWGVRVLDAPAVFTPDGVRPVGPDAYYHLRRVAYGYARFPAVLEHDPYLNYPAGGDVIWPPGLDWSVAAAARVWLGPGASPERLERFALAVPVALGLVVVAGTFAWGAARFGGGAGLAAALALALLPAHAQYSRLGMLDHHAAEPLATLALLAAAAALAHPGRGRGLAVVAFAGAVAGSLLVWPGTLLQLALVDAVLWALAVFGVDRVAARRLAVATALGHAGAALLLAPFADREYAQWGTFAPVVLSAFQPWLLGVTALGFTSLGAVADRSRGVRIGAGAFVGLALVALSAALWPELLAAPADAWGWLARTEAFQSQVSESRPLLAAGRRGELAGLLSWAGWLTPLLVLAFGAALRRRPDPAGWLLLALGLGLGAAAAAQSRFANPFSVPFALMLGWAGVVALPGALGLAGRGRAGRAALGGLLAVAAVVAFLPCLDELTPALQRRNQVQAGRPMQLGIGQWQRHELHRMANWIARHTPETSGFLPGEGAPPPEYGVLGNWWTGHILTTVARRPAVATNFGDDLGPENLEAVGRYYGASEAEASAILEALGARYVVMEFRKQRPLDAFGPGSMVARAFFADGEVSRRSLERRGGRERRVSGEFPALVRHRLVYEARGKPWAPEQPFYKLYEHVAGARVEGSAPPSATVEAELALRTAAGRAFTWRTRVRADAEGRYRLRVPYANERGPAAVRAAPAYTLRAGDASGALVVRERDVQEGRSVRGPDLDAPATDLAFRVRPDAGFRVRENVGFRVRRNAASSRDATPAPAL